MFGILLPVISFNLLKSLHPTFASAEKLHQDQATTCTSVRPHPCTEDRLWHSRSSVSIFADRLAAFSVISYILLHYMCV